MKIVKLNKNSFSENNINKKFFQEILSSYSIGISKNLWKNYSIKIGNNSRKKIINIVFYKTNFDYPIINISCTKDNDEDLIVIENNKKRIKILKLNEMKNWFKNYFLDRAKI